MANCKVNPEKMAAFLATLDIRNDPARSEEEKEAAGKAYTEICSKIDGERKKRIAAEAKKLGRSVAHAAVWRAI